MCKQYSVQKKGKKTSSAQFNTEFRKTQDPLNIVLNCRVLYLQGYAKKSFFFKISQKMYEEEEMNNNKYRNVKKFQVTH